MKEILAGMSSAGPKRGIQAVAAAAMGAMVAMMLGACNGDKVSGEAPLSNREFSSLRAISKQEKLARDVHVAMHDIWRDDIFRVNAEIDQAHLDRLRAFADEHRVRDFGADDPPGRFSDPAIQQRYDGHVAAGSASRVEALRTSTEVKESAVLDLESWSADVTLRDDFRDAYRFMACESRNQLRAFHAELAASGGSYQPARMAPIAYELLVRAPAESC